MTNAGIKAVLKKAMLENEKISTAWLGFYLNVYLYLALVTSAVAIPTTLFGLYNIPLWIGAGSFLEPIWFFVSLTEAVAAIMTFIELRDFKLAGYKWNIVLLVSSSAEYTLSMLSVWLRGEPGARMDIGFLIAAQVVAVLIWLIPNLIYFRKRKHLFRPYTTTEVAAALKGEPPAPALPVRKPCHYKPTKVKVDMMKLFSSQADGKETRLMRIMEQHNKVKV